MAISREARVGLTALAGLLGAAALVVFLGRIHFTKPGYPLTVRYRYVDSLKPAAPVLFGGGVRIGEVDRLSIQDGLVAVHMHIQKEVQIPKDSVISIHTSGILGEKYVQVSAGDMNSGILAPDSVLDGVDPGSLDRTLQKVEALTAFLEPLLNDPKFRNGVQGVLAGLNKVTDDLSKMVNENRGDIRSSVQDLRVLAAELRKRSDELKPVLANMGAMVNPANTKKVLNSLDTLDRSMGKLDKILVQIESKKGAAGVMIYDESAGDDLRQLLSDLKRHPWKLLWKK